MSRKSWEEICKRCGRCCYEKLDHQGTIYYTRTPCDRLNLKTRLCTVYKERHQARPDCIPLTPEAVEAGFLPADCPYVQRVKDYKPPVMPEDSDLYDEEE